MKPYGDYAQLLKSPCLVGRQSIQGDNSVRPSSHGGDGVLRSCLLTIDAPLRLVQANIRDFDLREVVRHFEFFSIEDDDIF